MKYKIPEPDVKGSEQIEVVSHGLIGGGRSPGRGVAINLRNVSGGDIAKVVFSVVFYDRKGNAIDEAMVNMVDFEKDKTCVFPIESSSAAVAGIESYRVKVVRVIMAPTASAVGDDRVVVVEHGFRKVDSESGLRGLAPIDLTVRNVSDKTIATAVFDVVIYDLEGNVLDRARHREFDLGPKCERIVSIVTDKGSGVKARSYGVTVLKTVTTDVEKVRVCEQEIRGVETGGEEVIGVVKNMSDVKTDAALLAIFRGCEDKKIGARVIAVKDIEPGAYKQFRFIFDTPKGEIVSSYLLGVGEMVEEGEETG